MARNTRVRRGTVLDAQAVTHELVKVVDAAAAAVAPAEAVKMLEFVGGYCESVADRMREDAATGYMTRED